MDKNKRRTILYAEDDPTIMKIVSINIKRNFNEYHLETFKSGLELEKS
jgi:hypothetical protein|tara:strand:- start:5626 stop:5769 length:144 start_codon:yes stop_codon:yes gene_type:complete